MTIATLIVNIAAQTADLQRQVSRVNSQLEGISSVAGTMAASLGIGFSIGAVVKFVGSVMSAADSLERMKDQTGIGVESLQRLQAAAENSGNSLDQIVRGVSKLQVNLGSGNKGAVGAVRELGLNLDDLLTKDPEGQFLAVAEAVGKIEDPSKRAALAVALFGKAGVELLPTLRSDILDVTKSVTVMSKETTAALDQFGDAWAGVGRTVKATAGNMLAFGIKFAGDYITQVWDPQAAAIQRQIDKINELKNMLPEAPKAPAGLLPKPLGMPQIDTALEEKLLKGRLEARAAALKKAAEDEKTLIASMSQLYQDAVVEEIIQLDQLHLANVRARVDPIREAQAALRAGIGVKDLGQGLGMQGLAQVPATLDKATGAIEGIFGSIGKAVSWDHFKDTIQKGAGTAIGNAMSGLIGMMQKKGGILGDIGTGAQMGMAFGGPWGAAIGAGIGAAVNGIKKLLKTEEKQVNDMRDKFQQMNFGSLAAMNDAFHKVGLTVDKVLSAKKVKDFDAAVAEFNRRLALQKESWDKLQGVIQKYGFTIEELGPALQRQKLDEMASGLYEDWMLLAGAGVDLDAIARRMSESINEYIHLALRLGLEVPSAMKPMLQKMIDMGLLTDLNGNKIETLEDSGLTFSDTMTESFNKVILAIDRMTAALQAFLDITRESADEVRNFPTPPDKPLPGDDNRSTEGYALGTRGRLVNFGRGRRVTLHGWERVSTAAEERGRGGSVTVIVNGGSFDTPLGRQRTVEHISRAVMDAQRRTQRIA